MNMPKNEWHFLKKLELVAIAFIVLLVNVNNPQLIAFIARERTYYISH